MTRSSGASTTRFLEAASRLFSGAADFAEDVGGEIDGALRSRLERIADELDLVTREEFEVMRDAASRARSESEALRREVETLKERLSSLESGRDDE